jgi:hypothetical protein
LHDERSAMTELLLEVVFIDLEGAPEVPDSRPTTMGSLEQERW